MQLESSRSDDGESGSETQQSSTGSETRPVCSFPLRDWQEASLDVPHASLFFSSSGVMVRYVLSAEFPGTAGLRTEKQFSALAEMHKQLESVLSDRTSRVDRWLKKKPTVPTFPKRRLVGGSTNQYLKYIIERRLALSSYFKSFPRELFHVGGVVRILEVLFSATQEGFADAHGQSLNYFCLPERLLHCSNKVWLETSGVPSNTFGCIPAVYVRLPHARLENRANRVVAVIESSREDHATIVFRAKELFAFYEFIASRESGEIPDAEAARRFFHQYRIDNFSSSLTASFRSSVAGTSRRVHSREGLPSGGSTRRHRSGADLLSLAYRSQGDQEVPFPLGNSAGFGSIDEALVGPLIVNPSHLEANEGEPDELTPAKVCRCTSERFCCDMGIRNRVERTRVFTEDGWTITISAPPRVEGDVLEC